MNDTIIRGMAANNQVRFFCGYTKELVENSPFHPQYIPCRYCCIRQAFNRRCPHGKYV